MNNNKNKTFTHEELLALHRLCMTKLIVKARNAKATGEILEHDRLLRSIKILFFDKKYYLRGFYYNPNTNLYTWAW